MPMMMAELPLGFSLMLRSKSQLLGATDNNRTDELLISMMMAELRLGFP